MYAKFFGLQQEPFSIAPDPRYLFMSERHRDALAHLLYGLQGGGGFVLLTGEIGAGKTTVCRCFLEQIPAHCNVAYIFNPKLTVSELLRTVCEEYRIPLDAPTAETPTVKFYVDRINEFLLRTHAAGQHNVLIIDEAQNLSAEVLEQLRLLTNLETHERKLLQIILIGQPELREMLARPELEQLAQRVIARFHLQALSEAETAQYVRHRLDVAGFDGAQPFERAALKRIHRLARGVPRRINLLCDRALLGAYAQGRKRIDRATLDRAAAEVFDDGRNQRGMASKGLRRRLAWGLGAAGLCAAAAVALVGTRSPEGVAANRPVAAPLTKAVSAASAAASPKSAAVASGPSGGDSLASRDERAAWQELARAWQAEELPAGEEPCQALQRQQLQCFRSEGGMALLRLLARPAILTLREEGKDGPAAYVTLVGLDGQQAQLSLGGRSQTIGLLELNRQWRGEFATLWRAPQGYQPKFTEGPALDWLDAQLAKAFGEKTAPVAGARRYDAALQARVAAFQRAQGLASDGRAGPVTLMQLNRAAGVAEPRLVN